MIAALASIAATLTFVLLLLGGLVNPTGASLACPEAWFVCHGQWFPALRDGVLYEHGHRLAAMTVGLLQIAMTLLLWLRRPELRAWGIAALLLVCLQGALGALTVQAQLQWLLSTAHLVAGLSYFTLLVTIAWRVRPRRAGREWPRLARRWTWVAAVSVFVQIVLGGIMRHNGGALASVDWPLHQGSVWPRGAALPLQLHMAHRLVGVLVAAIVCLAASYLWRAARRVGDPVAAGLTAIIPVAVAAQIAFGFWIIASFRSVPVVMAHFCLAVLLWTCWVLLLLRVSVRRVAEAPRGGMA